METIKKMESMDVGSWRVTLASLLPLWLLSLVFLPISLPGQFGAVVLFLALAVGVIFLIKGWVTAEILLYSLFPIFLLFIFEEVSDSYRTPFMYLCILVLTGGIIGYQRSLYRDSIVLGWLILVLFLVGTWMLANHADQNYWQMVGNLGIHDCSPDYEGCASLAGRGTHWLLLFFQL